MRNVSMTLTMDQCSELGETMDGTMTVTIPGSSCTLLAGDPTNMTMEMDMTIDDGVSILDFNNLTMEVSNLVYDQNGEITDMTVLLDGTVTEDQESVSFGDFHIDWTFDSVNTQYLTSMDGYIECPCVDGWLQITTQEDIVLPLSGLSRGRSLYDYRQRWGSHDQHQCGHQCRYSHGRRSHTKLSLLHGQS